MSLRKYKLEKALDRVLRVMNLRRPQRESLEALHRLVLHLGKDLGELSPADLVERVRDMHPRWSFAGGFPVITFALATGVGKTRLMGAIMAYLFLSGQSTNFLLLAPRAAILRKLEDEVTPGSGKYIFVDPSLVPETVVWHRGNLQSFKPDACKRSEATRCACLSVFSPQSLTGDDKRTKAASEFSGTSFVEHLRSLEDLIVIMDEAHHLGGVGERESKAWTEAIRHLGPRLQFGMTATPKSERGVNVLHSYDLRTCLQEKLYTKDVKLIVRQRSGTDAVSDEEWDHHTLDFALERLRRKEQAIEAYAGEAQYPAIRPVLLVCAEGTEHADRLGKWLVVQRGFREEEVLVTHSEKAKSEADIERLVGIERPNSLVRVVVNVYELTEGWDVTNVYVIAPLRRMGTFQGAVQTMGRGLRLPAGRRIDDTELDSLDVLCFGKESLQEILHSATRDFGEEEDAESGLDVRDAGDDDLAPEPPKKSVRIAAAREAELALVGARRTPIEPDLEFDVVTMRKLAERSAVEFNLALGEVGDTVEGLKFELSVFVRITAGRVLSGLRYLSEPIHRPQVEQLVDGFLRGLGQKDGDLVALDAIQVAEIVKEQIDRPYRKKQAVYEVTDSVDTIRFGDFDWRVVEKLAPKVPFSQPQKWDSKLQRLPIGGWKRCVHTAAVFDVEPEWSLAQVFDRNKAVEWWVRNDPPRLRIPTPIGYYEPDFIVRLKQPAGHTMIVEVKRGDLWTSIDSDPRVKARAADAWCAAVNAGTGTKLWSHFIVLDCDVERVETVDDVRKLSVNGFEAIGS